MDGNLICTDKECDIGCDGNVVLVTPKGGVLHIGKIPMPEVQGQIRCEFDSSNNLIIRVKIYYDCDHHHSGIEEIKIDTHLTEERKQQMMLLKLQGVLKNEVKAWTNGSYRNSLNFSISNGSNIVASGNVKLVRGYGVAKNYNVSQKIVFKEGEGFVLLPDENGKDSIFDCIRRGGICSVLEDFNKSIGLGKNTSYILVYVYPSDERCSILDTKDNVKEVLDKNTVLGLVQRGIKIIGVDTMPNGSVMFRPQSLS